LSEVFRLTHIKFLPLDSTLNYVCLSLILTSTLSLQCGRNVRIRVPTLFLLFLLFFFSFLFYIIYSLLRYRKSHGALAMAQTKPTIQKEQSKLPLPIFFKRVHTGPCPTYRHENHKKVKQGNPSIKQWTFEATQTKNKLNLALRRLHIVTKRDYIRRLGRN